MEGESSMETLRNLAPKWTLAGDDQLLNILQSTHQRIITKCQEVNSKLSEMSSALDDASISLQNVNNKFMAISNSQFVESRVYDDDDVSTENTPAKEIPPPKVESELSMLKRSIAVLESMHESVTILRDSDTETDSEDEEISRTVLKPKDMYTSRPLPHIIGSQAWKNKWHAGLLPEDSDSDSTTSKREPRVSDQYSESDQEMEETIQTDTLRVPDGTVSETSSELASEQDILPPSSAPKQTPSDVAAELARRLGGRPPKLMESEPEMAAPAKPPARKVYRPEQPVTGRVFLDEPPPIDDYLSESSSDNGDIFAELHKRKTHENKRNIDINPADDLFGFNKEDDYQGGDIFKDFAKDKVSSNETTKQKSSLFEKESEPDLFVEKRENKGENLERREEIESGTSGIKKPVGGISVFGNNKGAESIDAAILRRQLKSSSSSEKSSEAIDEGDSVSKNDIFDDLFDKSRKSQKTIQDYKPKFDEKVQKSVIDEILEKNKHKGAVKKDETAKTPNVLSDLFDKSTKKTNVTKNQITDKVDVKTTEKPKIDLFDDDIFNDIDDMFTANVVKIPKKDEKNQKSLFDDDDDLFAEIAPRKIKETVETNFEEDKEIFQSEDDLFTDKPKIKDLNTVIDNKSKPVITKETKEGGSTDSEIKKVDRSIFDSDDELFSKKTRISKSSKAIIITNTLKPIDNEPKEISINAFDEVSRDKRVSKIIFDSDDELFSNRRNASIDSKNTDNQDKPEIFFKETSTVSGDSKKGIKGIFDSDDEIFTSKSSVLKAGKSKEIDTDHGTIVKETKASGFNVLDEGNNKLDSNEIVHSKKSLFDSDSDTDLFSNNKIMPKRNEVISKSFNEPKQTSETNKTNQQIFDTSTKNLVSNKNDRLSNLKSPSQFDDGDEHLFTTKEKIAKSDVINKVDETDIHIFDDISVSDIIQKHKENIVARENVVNNDNENTQKYLNIDTDNDNKNTTHLKRNSFENIDESHNPIEYTSNVPETDNNKGLSLTKDNKPLQIETKKPSNTITEVKDTSITINSADIFAIDSKCKEKSILNVKEVDKSHAFEEQDADSLRDNPEVNKYALKTNNGNNMPVGIVTNKIKDDSLISIFKSKDQETIAFTDEDVDECTQKSNLLGQIEKSKSKTTEPHVLENIFNEPPDLNKAIDLQTKESSQNPGIFSDIFTEPPIFEKPKEPKRSKNVNALFDDDSDDEALFFRKSDVVDDVSHDFIPDVKQDNLFGIFHDEPPAIDVDFSTKTKDYSLTSQNDNTRNILEFNKDHINDNNQSEVNSDNKKTNKIDITPTSTFNEATEVIAQELIQNQDSKAIKSELKTSTDTNIFKTFDKKLINIHDLFRKDDNIYKNVDTSSSKGNQKSLEPPGENFKSLNVGEYETGKLIKDKKTTSLFDDQSDEDLFKSPSNVNDKKTVIVQEDEIDNLFIAKNKNPNFDDIFKTNENEILIKETKIIHDIPNNDMESVTTLKEVKSIFVKENKILPHSSDDSNQSSESMPKLKDENFIKNIDDSKTKLDIESSGTNKIGKLKAKMNIDVSKLLPGASPKKKIDKPKSPDQENTSAISIEPTLFGNKDIGDTKLGKESNGTKTDKPVTNEGNKYLQTPPSNNDDNSVSQTSQSVSFDEQGSRILDNTLSKERAKIQVKRRPSTRRARREAVRKSTIDNDSTDNSSSIDDQPKSLDIDVPLNIDQQGDLSPHDIYDTKDNNEKLQTDIQTNIQSKEQDDKSLFIKKDIDPILTDIETNFNFTDNSSSIEDQPKSLDVDLSVNIDKQDLSSHKIVNSKANDEKLQSEEQTTTQTNIQSKEQDEKSLFIKKDIETNFNRQIDKPNRNVTSKVVYVLNDEDIFSTKTESNVLEKDKLDSNFAENVNPIATLGNVYKIKSNIRESVARKDVSKPKAPLFEPSSDDEKIFGKGKNRKIFSTKLLFDSDSDDDLFVGNKDRKETKDDVKKKVPIVKGSLFGDDDDDDLFGDKRKKSEKQQPSRPSTSREDNKSTEPVFQDPLSMFRN